MRYHELLNTTRIHESSLNRLSARGWAKWLKNPTTFDNDMGWLQSDIEDMGGIKQAFEVMDGWRNKFPDQMRLFRGLPIKGDVKEWLNNPVGSGGGVGICWAYDKRGAFNDGFARGDTTVVLVGRTAKSSVDWYCTFALHIVDSDEEKEIRLMTGAPVFIEEAWVLDDDYEVLEVVPVGREFRA